MGQETLRLDSTCSKVVQVAIGHLTDLPGAKTKVNIEIAAEILRGVPEHIVRTVTKNSRALAFEHQGLANFRININASSPKT